MKLLTELLSARQPDETQKDFEQRRVLGQGFQMALLTGARVGEVTTLRWEQIDFKAKILQIIGRKNRFKIAKVVRYLELTPTMEEILRERKEINAFGDFVFCRTGNSVTAYQEILREDAEAVGVNYGAKTARWLHHTRCQIHSRNENAASRNIPLNRRRNHRTL